MGISMADLTPKPHPMLAFLEERRIPILRISYFMGLTYPRVWQILKGYAKAKPAQEDKLEALRLALIEEDKVKLATIQQDNDNCK